MVLIETASLKSDLHSSLYGKRVNFETKNMDILNNWRIIILACLTLGLAPFFPEPHLWGKINWILGGAHSMQLLDWFDTIMHGLPFILLIRIIFVKLKRSSENN